MFIKYIKSKRFSKNRYAGCILKCDNCGKEIIRKVNKSFRSPHHFCDYNCRTNYWKSHSKEFAVSNKKRSEALKGSKSYLWKGGKRYYDKYSALYVPDHPHSNKAGYVMEHRLVMEKSVGRYLDLKEVVHHIDNDPTNNDINNLMLFKVDADHQRYHKKIRDAVL